MITTQWEYDIRNRTKQITYADGQRICSKIGGGFAPAPTHLIDSTMTPITGNYAEMKDGLNNLNLRLSYNAYYGININPESNMEILDDAMNNNDVEEDLFFYHSNLPMAIGMGSGSWISDASGVACEHLQYLPYGELRSNLELLFNKKQECEKNFIHQKSGSFSTRYQFTGKEKDSETGFNYFGARYYDSDISVWLSVDPMADKYPSLSPFNYCANNPVMLVDPDGRKIIIFTEKGRIEYKPGMEVPSNADDFARETILCLNYIHSYKSKDGINRVQVIHDSEVETLISFNSNPYKNSMYFEGMDLEWNYMYGNMFEDDDEYTAPITSIAHEIDHAYRFTLVWEEYYKLYNEGKEDEADEVYSEKGTAYAYGDKIEALENMAISFENEICASNKNFGNHVRPLNRYFDKATFPTGIYITKNSMTTEMPRFEPKQIKIKEIEIK